MIKLPSSLGPLVLLVLEQPRWNGNNQLHLDFTGIVQEEHFRSQEHDLPHGHELSSTSTKTSKEASSMHRRIGEGRGSHEGGALHQGTTVDSRVHEWHHSTSSHLLKELLVHLSTQQLEVVLEGHVRPDGLVFKPTWREGHHSSHIVALSLQAGREEVHVELVVTKSRS